MNNRGHTPPTTTMVIVRIVGYTILVAALLFGLSGRLDWTMAWVYLCVLTISTGVNIYVVVYAHPGLLAERMKFTKAEDIKTWDKVLSPLMAVIGPTLILIVAALDVRYEWSPAYSTLIRYGCMMLVAAGAALTTWALVVNQFFSSVVRIQKDRRHVVVDAGPYQFVRHPGYSGAIFYYAALPLALGSLWGLLPAGLTVIVTVIRTALEDKMLRNELDGYIDYAKRIRYRLVPALW